MTQFEALLNEIGEGLGEKVAPDTDGIAQISVAGRIILLKSNPNDSEILIFSIVADAKDNLEKALSLNLFGLETQGAHLGLFVDQLILSRNIALADLTGETFAERLVAFAHLCESTLARLSAPSSTLPSPQSELHNPALIHV